MANVIDALFVTLGMDVKAFKKGAEDAIKVDDKLTSQTKRNTDKREALDKRTAVEQKKHSEQFRKDNKANMEGVRKLRNQLIGIAALFTGGLGLARFASSTIDTAANVGRLSNDLGESTLNLLAWQRASEAVGGSAEGMSSAMAQASKTASLLKVGGPGDRSQFLGIQTMAGMAGMSVPQSSLTSATGILLEESRIIQQMAKQRGMAVAFQQAQTHLGMDQGTFDLLKRGPAAVQAMVAAQKPFAESTARLNKRAQELQAKLSLLKNQFSDIGVTVLTSLMPSFDKLVRVLRQFGNWVDSNKTQINNWITGAANSTEQLAKGANDVAQALGGWKRILEGLLALKLAGFIAQMTGLASAFKGIGTAGALRILGPVGAVAGAGAAGAYAGSKIEKALPKAQQGYDYSDNIPVQVMTGIMALFGNKDAKYAWSMSHPQKPYWRQNMGPRFAWGNTGGSTSTSTVNIDNIHINTPATSADGIAQSIRPAIMRHMYAPQANTGVK